MAKFMYMLAPAVLLSLALPLALLAIVTTTIAITTLLLRLSFVYADLGFALIQSWTTLAFSSKKESETKVIAPLLDQKTYAHQRLPPKGDFHILHGSFHDASPAPSLLSTSGSSTSLLGSSVPNRDFEGVGGWRLTDDAQDEGLVIKMKSRTRLPASGRPSQRKLKRSVTPHKQRVSTSPEAMRMSPVTSRNVLSPSHQDQPQLEGYFDAQGGPAAAISPEEIATQMRMNQRRLSVSSSTTSSVSDLRAINVGMTQI